MASPTPGQSTKLGMAPNIAALLCYIPICCVPIVAVIAAIVEKENRFVRFHAFQSLLLAGACVVLYCCLAVVGLLVGFVADFLGLLMLPAYGLLGLVVLGVVIFMMVKAYGNEEYELPVIGEMARKWA